MPAYPPAIERVLRQPGLLGKLAPAEPLDRAERDRLGENDDAALAGSRAVVSPAALALVRGGLLYALDALDEAHAFFQEDKSDLAAYWHGMLHRREADFDNARYWFRRAGTQAFFAAAHAAAAEHSPDMARQSNWDPYLFTGQCEQAKFGAEIVEEMVALQRAEFAAVFEYTWRQAMG